MIGITVAFISSFIPPSSRQKVSIRRSYAKGHGPRLYRSVHPQSKRRQIVDNDLWRLGRPSFAVHHSATRKSKD
jgi:hypothetical protein